MAGDTETPLAGMDTGATSRPSLESGATGTPAQTPAAGNDPAELARRHGAVTTDLPAGELKKMRDRVRKWKQRNPGKVHPEEHLLPRPGATRHVASSPGVRRDPPAISALDLDLGDMGGGQNAEVDLSQGSEIPPEIGPCLDWTPEEVAEISDEVINGIDDWDKLDDVKKAKLAKLPISLVEQIEADAGLPAISKKLLLKFVPKFVARKLNEAKVDSRKSDGVLVMFGLLLAGADKLMRTNHLAKEAKIQAGQTVTDETKK